MYVTSERTRDLFEILEIGAERVVWDKSVENVPKKRVSSLWQLRSERGLPGRTARAFGALPGTQGVRLTDQTE